MTRIIVAGLLTLCLTANVQALQPGNETGSTDQSIADAPQFVIHIDVDRLTSSKSGQLILGAAKTSPFIAEQLATIPEDLHFLKTADLKAITIRTWEMQQATWPVIEMRADFDQAELVELIRQAHQYAAVKYRDVTVHQWVTDLEKLGNQFMGEKPQDEEPARDSIFLAMPTDKLVIVSASLSLLTKAVDRLLSGEQDPLEKSLQSKFGKGSDLMSMHSLNAEGSFPSEIFAVVREDESGALNVLAKVPCRTEIEQNAAKSINHILNTPESAAQMLSVVTAGEKDSVEKDSKTNSLKNGDKLKRNKITFTVSYDSKSLQATELPQTIDDLLTKCIRSEFADESLNLEARLFVGRPDIIFTPRQTDGQATKKTENVNLLLTRLNVYSTAKLRDAAIRVAEALESETHEKSTLKR